METSAFSSCESISVIMESEIYQRLNE
jgi:hypothetical protein